MSLHILATNIRRLRNARKISQQKLADSSGVSLASIKNIEGERTEPRVYTLEQIARALDVRLQDLFIPVRVLKMVRFRSGRRMQNRENILSEVACWLDDFCWLEQELKQVKPFKLSALSGERQADSAQSLAQCARDALGLRPDEPIHDICGLLESAGVKVLSLSMTSDSFFGLSVAEEEGGPAVVVNVWERIPVERRIFSAAHELGHLLLHTGAYDVGRVEENKEEEKEADLFAGYFLMPDEGFVQEWQAASGLSLVDRVFKVKRIFHVSYKTVLFRLIQRGQADSTLWAYFNNAYRRQFNRSLGYKEEPARINPAEPFSLLPFEFYEYRFSSLVREAIEKEKISLSRGAEMLRLSVEEMLERVSCWDVVA